MHEIGNMLSFPDIPLKYQSQLTITAVPILDKKLRLTKAATEFFTMWHWAYSHTNLLRKKHSCYHVGDVTNDKRTVQAWLVGKSDSNN